MNICRLGVAAIAIGVGIGTMAGCGMQSSVRPPKDAVRTNVPKGFDAVCKPDDKGDVDAGCAIETYQKALGHCVSASQYFESQVDRSTNNSLYVGIAGALAGSVFSIGAVGNAAKAWAGLSGVSNAYQTQLDSSSMGSASYKAAKENVERNIRALQKKLAGHLQNKKWGELYQESLLTGTACAVGTASE